MAATLSLADGPTEVERDRGYESGLVTPGKPADRLEVEFLRRIRQLSTHLDLRQVLADDGPTGAQE